MENETQKAKKWNREFLDKETQMVDKYFKIYSTFLALREMQCTILIFYLTHSSQNGIRQENNWQPGIVGRQRFQYRQ